MSITEDQIEQYLITCEGNRTFNQRLATYRSFFKWAKQKRHIDSNPAIEIEGKTVHKKEPKYLKLNEIIDLKSHIDGKYYTRDLAIILLLLNGLRRSEVCKANINDIEKDGDANVIRVVSGKGNKERVVILYPEAYDAIQAYLLEDYRQYSKNKALFITQNGNRLSGSTIAKQTKKYLEKINKGDLSCHKLRHTFATNLYKRTKNILAVQDQLGHTNIANTQIYTHLDREAIIKTVLGN
jgi:integrase/recombinase XerC